MFKIHSKIGCPYCENAKHLLGLLSFQYEEVLYDTDEKIADFKDMYGPKATFPQIYRENNGRGFHIGGYDDLVMVMREKLDW